MNQVAVRGLSLGLAAVVWSLPFGPASAQPAVSLEFQPSPEPVIATHEGGLFRWLPDLAEAQPAHVGWSASQGAKLYRSVISIGDFRYGPISDAFLARLQNGFDLVRSNGIKVIPKFVYSFQEGGEDAPLDRVLEHIGQLGPVLNANRDVIAYIDAGFVGAWGEWHSSRHGLDRPESRDQVKEALLANFPIERQILFRYPVDVRRWYPGGRGPLDDAAAHESVVNYDNARVARGALSSDAKTRSDQRRTGLLNDCFLSGVEDGGTFLPDTAALRQFAGDWNRHGMEPLPGSALCAAPRECRRPRTGEALGSFERRLLVRHFD